MCMLSNSSLSAFQEILLFCPRNFLNGFQQCSYFFLGIFYYRLSETSPVPSVAFLCPQLSKIISHYFHPGISPKLSRSFPIVL